jgi:threonine efflux protein
MIARLGVPRRLPVFSESDVMHNAYAANILTLSAIYAITCISPGPDFVNVTCHALNTRKSGMFAAAGVALGCCVWSTAAVFGLGLLMSGLVPLNHIMRIGGALYLRLSRIEEAARSPST